MLNALDAEGLLKMLLFASIAAKPCTPAPLAAPEYPLMLHTAPSVEHRYLRNKERP